MLERDVYCILKACAEDESTDITVKNLQAINQKCFPDGIFKIEISDNKKNLY